jgi:DNA polymerase-3 subunit beta
VDFTCPKDELLASATIVSRAVPSTTGDTNLLNVLLEQSGPNLTLLATDNRIALRHSQGVSPSHQAAAAGPGPGPGPAAGAGGEAPSPWPVRVAVRGHLLVEILQGVQTSRAADVHLATTPEGRVRITSADAVYNVSGFPAESFPLVPAVEPRTTLKLPGGLLKEMIRKTTVVSAGASGGPQTYEEVYVESRGGELSMVATDSVRLAIRTAQVPSADLPEFHCLIPSHALAELGRAVKPEQEVGIALAEDQASFAFGSTELRTRLSDKTFPNFRTILPKVQSRNLVLRTREFHDNLRGVIPLARDTKHKVFIDFEKERVVISSTSPEFGEARREVETSLSGEPIRLAFNGKYLLDFLSVVDSESFRWGVTSAAYPATLTPDAEDAGYTYILMPITHY